jgi:hopene-associated glycosyltransferase HpnB
MGRAAAGTSLAIWLWLTFFRGRFWSFQERLLAARLQKSSLAVTAVVPARDEFALIGRAVASLRAQQFGGRFRVIVADDQSSDGTGECAARAGADHIVHVSQRPLGWKGKLWAVESGIRADRTNPDYFLLTDADIERASPQSLSSLVAQAEIGFDLVSIMVRLRCESLAEKLLIPAFVFFFFKLYPPAWVASARATAAAAGGCMLIRREFLEQIGGIEAIHAALIDDCALATRVKAAGGRVWLGTARGAIRSVRAYERAADIRAMMITRSAFAQLNHSTVLLIGTIMGMLVTYVAPPLLLFSGDLLTIALSICAWLLSAVLFTPTVRAYEVPFWTAFCLPGIACFYLSATIESAIRYWMGRGGEWKGRFQDTGSSTKQ